MHCIDSDVFDDLSMAAKSSSRIHSTTDDCLELFTILFTTNRDVYVDLGTNYPLVNLLFLTSFIKPLEHRPLLSK